tara:strand:- start:458 stop:775 length:318 start_codon:yes stop_codon:yes gene_type:complete
MTTTIFNWNNANFTWDNNPYTWNEVALIKEAIGGGGDMDEMPWTKWEEDDKRKKKLIKLILKVHGNTITETKQKELKQYKIKASDIKITVEKVLGIEIMTENVKF